MPTESASPARKRADVSSREGWLRKHADYQRVYREGKRQSLPLMTYFFAMRPQGDATKPPGSRVGLTAGRVLGNAVARNRIKRRMRAAVRQHRQELTASVDVILHPRRTVLEAEYPQVERDVLRALRTAQSAAACGS
jgi:ribonuclease P protein component